MLPQSWQTATIAKDGTLSAEIDLKTECDTLLIYVPTIDSAQINILVSEKSGGTFADLYITDPADGGNNKVISGASTGGFHWAIPMGGFRFIKVKASAAQTTAAVAIRVAGVRS